MRWDLWMGALRERNFRLYFIGQLTSAVGTGMTSVALAFAVLASDRSATALGVVLAADAVSLAGFLLIGGVIADRLGRRRVMLTADMLRGVAQAILGVWVLAGHPPLWGFVVLAAVVGAGTAFFMPALTGLIPEVVTPDRLSQANALNGLSNSIGSIGGPALAGILVAAASPGWAIIADAISYGASVASLGLLRLAPAGPRSTETFLSQLRAGWGEFWSRTWLWVIVVQWSLGNAIILGPFFVLGAVVADKYLGGSTAWGTILAAQGAGAVAGGVLMLRLHVQRPLLVATLTALVFPLPLLALAYHGPVAVIAAGSFGMGFAMAVFTVLWNTTMQREIPSDLLSRVSSYDWFGSLVFLPIGFALAGPIAAAVGIRAAFMGASVWCVASTLVVLAVPAVYKLRTAPTKPADGTEPTAVA
ncbi:MAG: MFS transporter [Acidimicrobiales bacterium]